MSGMVVRYYILSNARWPDGEISASRDGVLISGNWHTTKSVNEIKAVLDRAQEQYENLKQEYPFGSRRDPLPFSGDPPCVVEQRNYRVFSSEYAVIATRTNPDQPAPDGD
jgi:hypothetical protein